METKHRRERVRAILMGQLPPSSRPCPPAPCSPRQPTRPSCSLRGPSLSAPWPSHRMMLLEAGCFKEGPQEAPLGEQKLRCVLTCVLGCTAVFARRKSREWDALLLLLLRRPRSQLSSPPSWSVSHVLFPFLSLYTPSHILGLISHPCLTLLGSAASGTFPFGVPNAQNPGHASILYV